VVAVLTTALAWWAASFLAHLVLWKARLPRRPTRALLRVFGAGLAAGLLSLAAAPSLYAGAGIPVPATPVGRLHAALLFVSLTLAYVTTYSAVEVDSPSLVMTKMIAGAGPAGLSRGEFDAALTDEVLVAPRVRDLVRDRLAALEGGRYRATRKGLRVAALFRFYRRVLGVSEPGG
jgi:hypothetical protein